eukprot:SAG31_NODE_10236_length_1166_cov_1.248360_1_plen_58_part_10
MQRYAKMARFKAVARALGRTGTRFIDLSEGLIDLPFRYLALDLFGLPVEQRQELLLRY